jgi:hypothetical protein
MTDSWYYMRGDQPVGPLSQAQLMAALLQSPYWHQEYVWKPGYDAWQKAGSVDELSSALAQAHLEQLEHLAQHRPRSRKASVLVTALLYAGLAIVGILGAIIYHALS